jgi:polyribonucleotide nucleotidyltransferase
VKTTTFGAFVSLLPGKDGLLHISELKKLAPGKKRIDNVEEVAQVGQKILVEIKEVDPRGKLSLMPVIEDAASEAPADDTVGAEA